MTKRKDAVIAAAESLTPVLAGMLDNAGVPGCALRIVFDDGDAKNLSLGTKRPGQAGTPDGHTVFMIGSCSKAFTAATAAVLEADGRIDLDAPVSDYVPVTLEAGGKKASLRHLLSNSSGLPNLGMSEIVTGRYLYGRIPGDYADAYPFGSAASIVEFLKDASGELVGPPGAGYVYSNEGFSLAGEVLAAATGKPFPDLVRETIFKPLGMSASGYRDSDLPPSRDEAVGCLSNGRAAPAYFEPAIAGAGGILSTADDMGRFVQALLQGGVIDGSRAMPLGSVSQLEIGRVNHKTAESLIGQGFGPELYGMGLMVYPDFLGTRIVAHGGSTGNFSSSIFYDRELGFGIAGLCNTGNGEGILALFAFMIAAKVLGREPLSVFPGFALERSLRALEGEYSCRGNAVSARISYRQGRLWWESTDGNGNSPKGAFPLETHEAASGLSFRFLNGPGAESEVVFHTGTDGLVRVRKDRNSLTRRKVAGVR